MDWLTEIWPYRKRFVVRGPRICVEHLRGTRCVGAIWYGTTAGSRLGQRIKFENGLN